MDFTPSQCRACKRKTGPTTCEAYPGRIPDVMLFGGGDHREPRVGDHGKLFEQASGEKAAEEFGFWEQVYGA